MQKKIKKKDGIFHFSKLSLSGRTFSPANSMKVKMLKAIQNFAMIFFILNFCIKSIFLLSMPNNDFILCQTSIERNLNDDCSFINVEPIFLTSEFSLRLINIVQHLTDCTNNKELNKFQGHFKDFPNIVQIWQEKFCINQMVQVDRHFYFECKQISKS